MPTTTRERTIDAQPDDVWALVDDPHHLPRWWPRVQRVEGVDPDRWTQVFVTQKGKPVRADFHLAASERLRLRTWEQELEDSPFERLMDRAITEIRLEPSPSGTSVTLEVRQKLRGFARFGWFLVKRANRRVLDEALDGLERACAR